MTPNIPAIRARLESVTKEVRTFEDLLKWKNSSKQDLEACLDYIEALTSKDFAHQQALKEAVEAEREACAKVADIMPNGNNG